MDLKTTFFYGCRLWDDEDRPEFYADGWGDDEKDKEFKTLLNESGLKIVLHSSDYGPFCVYFLSISESVKHDDWYIKLGQDLPRAPESWAKKIGEFIEKNGDKFSMKKSEPEFHVSSEFYE